MKIEKVDIHTYKAELEKTSLTIPIFNSLAWLNLFDERLNILVIYNNNQEMIGSFFGLVGKKYGLPYFINAQFTPHCGLFYVNPSLSPASKAGTDKKVIELISEYLQQQKFKFIQFYLPFQIIDVQPFIWAKYTVGTKYTYQISLSDSEETLFSHLASEKRKSIRKAESDHIKIERITDFHAIENILLDTFIINKIKFDLKIFQKILYEFSNDANAYAFAAYNEKNEILAATLCLFDKTTAYYLAGGIHQTNSHHGAHVSCMWQSIIYAKSLGIATFDFEGSMIKNIEKYFREFGGILTPYFEIKSVSKLLKLLKK
jgi:Acetyltransferase (GNAT) domain